MTSILDKNLDESFFLALPLEEVHHYVSCGNAWLQDDKFNDKQRAIITRNCDTAKKVLRNRDAI